MGAKRARAAARTLLLQARRFVVQLTQAEHKLHQAVTTRAEAAEGEAAEAEAAAAGHAHPSFRRRSYAWIFLCLDWLKCFQMIDMYGIKQ